MGSLTEGTQNDGILLSEKECYSSSCLSTLPTYREITGVDTGKATVISVDIPAFNDIDGDDLPDTPMLLEIRYKDTLRFRYSSGDTPNRTKVESILSLGPGNDIWNIEPRKIAGLGGKNDGYWKVEQVLIDKTPFQFARAIDDGSGNEYYKFEITLGYGQDNTGKVALNLPIDYIALHALAPVEFDKIKELRKDLLGLVEIKKDHVTVPLQNAVLFTRNPTEPVYDYTYPDFARENVCDEGATSCAPIRKNVARGEAFPFSFSIASPLALPSVTINLNSLSSGLTPSMFKVHHVVNEDRFWLGRDSNNAYSSMPDRVEILSSVNIEADKTKRFWITATLPESIPPSSPGTPYLANISVFSEGVKIFEIPVEIEVMNFQLEEPLALNFLYINPKVVPQYVGTTSAEYNFSKIWENVIDHEISIVKWPRAIGAYFFAPPPSVVLHI